MIIFAISGFLMYDFFKTFHIQFELLNIGAVNLYASYA